MVQVLEASLDIPVDGIGRTLDFPNKAALFLRAHFSTVSAYCVKPESGSIEAEFLRRHIGGAVCLGRIRLPVISHACRIESGACSLATAQMVAVSFIPFRT